MNIDNLFAGQTRSMMMFAGVGIKPRLGLGIAYLLRYPEMHKSLKNPVDGSSRYPGQPVMNGRINLIGSRMVNTGREILENRASLCCQRKPVLTTALFHQFQFCGYEILPSLLIFAHFGTLLQKHCLVNILAVY